jgi:hypothetical protein
MHKIWQLGRNSMNTQFELILNRPGREKVAIHVQNEPILEEQNPSEVNKSETKIYMKNSDKLEVH